MDGHMKHFLRLHLIFWLSLLGFTFSAFSVAASSYKWTDSKGNVHYSQHPPKGKSYEKIKTPKHRSPSSPTPSPSSSDSNADKGIDEYNDGSDVLKKERANNAEVRKKNCESAKHNLNAYSVYRRIKDPDGMVRVITDKERAEAKKLAEEGIREFCD